jgi:hypothetical protein
MSVDQPDSEDRLWNAMLEADREDGKQAISESIFLKW